MSHVVNQSSSVSSPIPSVSMIPSWQTNAWKRSVWPAIHAIMYPP